MTNEKKDVYQRITDRIVSELEQGTRPWFKPWNAEHTAGRITRPLRFNGVPYQGINIVMLWSEAMAKGYAAPIWMTFRQAKEMGGYVRKGEKGSLVVYADRIRRTEIDEVTGDEQERDIPFTKGYSHSHRHTLACNNDLSQSSKIPRVNLCNAGQAICGYLAIPASIRAVLGRQPH